MTTNTTLRSALTAARSRASETVHDSTVTLNRLDLADMLHNGDVPEGALIRTLEWPEHPNGDGTYDVSVTNAYLPNSEPVGEDFTDSAVPAGRYDGNNDWDIFLHNPDDPTLLSATKVYAWVREQADTTP